jgi:hypothetical protein
MSSIDEEKEVAMIYTVADLDVKDTLSMIEHFLAIRKEYANIYTRTDEFEHAHAEAINGFRFCNSEIKKLLGIL